MIVGFVSPKRQLGSFRQNVSRSDAFVACRGTRWLVRSLYFPVFLQIRNLPSPVSRSQAHTPPRSRGAFLRPGFVTLLHSPRMRGGRSAEKRSGARRNTREACRSEERRVGKELSSGGAPE